MALLLRVGGWLIFASGLVIFLSNGGIANAKDPLSVTALVLMPLGMLCTGASTVIAWRTGLKRLESELRAKAAADAAPPPPSSDPEKRYSARTLDPGKLKKPDASGGPLSGSGGPP